MPFARNFLLVPYDSAFDNCYIAIQFFHELHINPLALELDI